MKTRTVAEMTIITMILALLVACTPLCQAAEPTPTPTPIPAPEEEKININTATLEELQTLPGIGEKIAQAIVIGRPYAKVEDLLEVKGIGEKKLAKIRSLIVCQPVEESESEDEETEEQSEKEQPKATPTPAKK